MNFKCWKYSLISALVISGAIISWQRYAFAQSDDHCQPTQTCNPPIWHHWPKNFKTPIPNPEKYGELEELQKLYPQAIRQLQHEDPQAIQKLKRLEPETVERLEQLAPNSRQQLQR